MEIYVDEAREKVSPKTHASHEILLITMYSSEYPNSDRSCTATGEVSYRTRTNTLGYQLATGCLSTLHTYLPCALEIASRIHASHTGPARWILHSH